MEDCPGFKAMRFFPSENELKLGWIGESITMTVSQRVNSIGFFFNMYIYKMMVVMVIIISSTV